MSKLINHAEECGYRKHLKPDQYPKWVVRAICTKITPRYNERPSPCAFITGSFPSHCPLEDGMTRQQFLDEQKPNIILVALTPAKKVRHTRKACNFYIHSRDMLGRCSSGIRVTQNGNSIVCEGVNCGYYKTI